LENEKDIEDMYKALEKIAENIDELAGLKT